MLLIIILGVLALLTVYLVTKYLRSSPYDSLPEMSLAELAKHDGSSGTSYIGVGPYVFDVTSSEL